MRSALENVDGVVSAKVTMPDKAVVTIDKAKNVPTEKLIAAVKQAGGNYTATAAQ